MPRTLRVLLVAIGIAFPSSVRAQQLQTIEYASGFATPVAFVQDPNDRTIQFVVQQGGRIRVVRNGTVLADDFLNLTGSISSGGERGLLGLAFAPDTATSGNFFVNFTNPAGHTVIARFQRSTPGQLIVNPNTRSDLRIGGNPVIEQPYANHNGGHLAFGPDGYLYIGLGDGGSGDDPQNRAQNPNELLGKMLRIDVNVSNSNGYIVPPDNPFVSGRPIAARPEIWAFGLRNPWRYNFDDPRLGGSGALIIADVGQNRYEEIDVEPLGAGGRNYGWRIREAGHDNVTFPPAQLLPLVDPVFEYDHSTGQSITGGYVYRGSALGPNYVGRYFFADFIAGRVWSALLTNGTLTDAREHTAELGGTATLGNVSSFGVDADGELYIVSYSRGVILKIRGRAPSAPTGLRIIQ